MYSGEEKLDHSVCHREMALEFAVSLLKDTGEKSASKVLGVALDFENYLNGTIPDIIEVNKPC